MGVEQLHLPITISSSFRFWIEWFCVRFSLLLVGKRVARSLLAFRVWGGKGLEECFLYADTSALAQLPICFDTLIL